MSQRWADYSQRVTSAQLVDALRASGSDGVLHYLGGDNALRLELVSVVQDVREQGWPQMGISVPRLATVSGRLDVYQASNVYGFGPGFRLWLDVEPEEFDLDPAGWAVAADGWCDDVRAGNMSPGVYGVDRTVAACGSRADRIWRAKPGQCDPAGPGLDPAFLAGRRMVQCEQGVWAGVEMDLSYSEEHMATLDDVMQVVSGIDIEVGAGYLPNGIGKILMDGVAAIAAAQSQQMATLGVIVQRLGGLGPAQDADAIARMQADLDASVSDLKAKLGALGSHLGQGNP